MFYRCVFFDI